MKSVFVSFLLSLFAVNTIAQESMRVHFSGKSPDITNFIDALLSNGEEMGEAKSLFKSYWTIYKKKQELPPAVKIKIDKPNGYVSFNHYYAEDRSNLFIETCYWNCADGRHKVIAQVIATSRDGRPLMGQYDGLTFYTYDSKTRQMKWTPTPDLCSEEFLEYGLTDGSVIRLPQAGKDITLKLKTANGMRNFKLKWTGSRFLFVKN